MIKAASFKDGWLRSPIKTRTFILDDQNNNFPAVFLSTDPDNFFDYNTGIYEMGPNASSDYPILVQIFGKTGKNQFLLKFSILTILITHHQLV